VEAGIPLATVASVRSVLNDLITSIETRRTIITAIDILTLPKRKLNIAAGKRSIEHAKLANWKCQEVGMAAYPSHLLSTTLLHLLPKNPLSHPWSRSLNQKSQQPLKSTSKNLPAHHSLTTPLPW
jgi:hypothetical protein